MKAGRSSDARALPVSAANPDAYRLYVLGQRALTLRGQSLRSSVDYFRRATEMDTLYANAFSGLSLALALTPYFQNTSSLEVAPEVRRAAQRALRLDPTLAQPHVALGVVYQHALAWDSAGVELQTAVRLRSSDDIEPLVQYGRYLVWRGRNAEALTQFLEARRTEPASALVSSWVSYAYYLQGQLDSALVESARAFQNDTTNLTTLEFGALVRLTTGDSAGARDFVNRLPRFDPYVLYVLGATGDTAAALARVHELERERPARWLAATRRALGMLGVGDTTAAMAALERATAANEIWPSFHAVTDPAFDPIRSSARFHQLLRSVNLPVSESRVNRRPRSR
jgi:Tfp pilus assembly protein PilF